MGHLPGLDGIRAVAVLAVVAYHLGWGALRGGFLGVEVFFVVSGYLITSLLLEERATTGRTDLRRFWVRRARRLLPALAVMLGGVAVWTLLFADPMAGALRRDLVPALVYISNWWQIVGVDTPYFAPSDPPLLRHLWSLAVEEQWYLLWPLLFPVVVRWSGGRRARAAGLLFGLAGTLMLTTAVASWGADDGRLNLLYLSTVTRSTGLLAGAAAAFVWRPWQGRHDRVPTRALELAGLVSLVVLGAASAMLTVSGLALYRGGLAMATIASVVLVAAAVHPASGRLARVLGHPVLVAIGRRSYGLYLWHWPIIVFCDARGDWSGTVTALALTVVVTEASYRFVETPVRRGVIGSWWASWRLGPVRAQPRRIVLTGAVGASLLFLTATVVAGLGRARTVDPAVDTTSGIVWEAPQAAASVDPSTTSTTVSPSAPITTVAPPATVTSEATAPVTVPVTTPVAVPVVVPERPVNLVVVGDSQAGSFAKNVPTGLEQLFAVSDGSLNGCGIYDSGVAVSARPGFRRDFAECADWSTRWASAATRAQADVALVMIGAWEVLDLEWQSTSLPVGAPRTDLHFLRQAQTGIDALVEAGAKVALLEVACMRPIDAPGAGVPPLPERGDDARVAHLNQLLRTLAERNPDTTTFLTGPVEWCSGSPVSVDTAYRWDGVHVYKPGVDLIFDVVAGRLLQFAAT